MSRTLGCEAEQLTQQDRGVPVGELHASLGHGEGARAVGRVVAPTQHGSVEVPTGAGHTGDGDVGAPRILVVGAWDELDELGVVEGGRGHEGDHVPPGAEDVVAGGELLFGVVDSHERHQVTTSAATSAALADVEHLVAERQPGEGERLAAAESADEVERRRSGRSQGLVVGLGDGHHAGDDRSARRASGRADHAQSGERREGGQRVDVVGSGASGGVSCRGGAEGLGRGVGQLQSLQPLQLFPEQGDGLADRGVLTLGGGAQRGLHVGDGVGDELEEVLGSLGRHDGHERPQVAVERVGVGGCVGHGESLFLR